MKKIVTLFMTGLLLMMCTASVFAAENPSVAYHCVRRSTTNYAVAISSENGKVTDGVTEIKYDAKALTISEEDITVSEDVDLYSVNVADGVVKISYIAEEGIAKGAFITMVFEVTDAYVNESVEVTVDCTAHDASGAALSTGKLVLSDNSNSGSYEDATESTEASGSQGGSNGTDTSGSQTGTGSTAKPNTGSNQTGSAATGQTGSTNVGQTDSTKPETSETSGNEAETNETSETETEVTETEVTETASETTEANEDTITEADEKSDSTQASVNAESNSNTRLIVGIIALLVVAVAAVVAVLMMKKKAK